MHEQNRETSKIFIHFWAINLINQRI